MKKKLIILGVCGSIAAYKALDLLSHLKEEGFEVKVIMTHQAKEFVSPLSFQVLSGSMVYDELFKLPQVWEPQHISLADSADLVVIAPATACFIGKLASGICDDLLSCVVLATKAKVLIAPAMNENMFRHPSVEKNIRTLKKQGYKFVGPVYGRLASGRKGVGRLAETKVIVKKIKKMLAR